MRDEYIKVVDPIHCDKCNEPIENYFWHMHTGECICDDCYNKESKGITADMLLLRKNYNRRIDSMDKEETLEMFQEFLTVETIEAAGRMIPEIMPENGVEVLLIITPNGLEGVDVQEA
jgi:hypothetical protein